MRNAVHLMVVVVVAAAIPFHATAAEPVWGARRLVERAGEPFYEWHSGLTLPIPRFPGGFSATESLTVDQANFIVMCAQSETDWVNLDRVTDLTDDVVDAVAWSCNHNDHRYDYHPGLSLNGLTTCSDKAASAFAKYCGDLSLNGLTTLSDKAAKALSQHEFRLRLNGLTTLSDDAAKALAQHKGGLGLNGLTTLSDEAAKALAENEYDLSFNGLTTLSDGAVAALRAKPRVKLPDNFKR